MTKYTILNASPPTRNGSLSILNKPGETISNQCFTLKTTISWPQNDDRYTIVNIWRDNTDLNGKAIVRFDKKFVTVELSIDAAGFDLMIKNIGAHKDYILQGFEFEMDYILKDDSPEEGEQIEREIISWKINHSLRSGF